MALTREQQKKRDRAVRRVRNALLGGGAAAGLASILAKPDHAYKWARAGFAGGAAIGAMVNPRKRAELAAKGRRLIEFGPLGHPLNYRRPAIINSDRLPASMAAYAAPGGITREDLAKHFPASTHAQVKSGGAVLRSTRSLDPRAAKAAGYSNAKDATRDMVRHELVHSIQSAKRGGVPHTRIRDLIKDEIGAYRVMDRRAGKLSTGQRVLRVINKASGVPLSTAVGVALNPALRRRAAAYAATGGVAAAAVAAVRRRRRSELSATGAVIELAKAARDERGRKLVQLVAKMRRERQPKEGFWARNGVRIAGVAAGVAAAGALATWKDRGMHMKYEPGHTVTGAMIGRPAPEAPTGPAPSSAPKTPPPVPKPPKGPKGAGLPTSVKAQMRGPGRRVQMPGKSPRRKKEFEAIAQNVKRLVSLASRDARGWRGGSRSSGSVIEFNEQDERQANRFTPSIAAGTLYRKGRRALVGVKRTGNFAQDVADVAAGRKAQGKREWQKSWFKNAVAGAALGAALGAPRIYAKVVTQRSGGADNPTTTWPGMASHFRRTEWPKIKTAVRNMRAARKFFAVGRVKRALIELDMQAAMNGWDVRDPRGKSARVFAPGSRRRERREKTKWEKVDTIRAVRNAAIAAAVAGAAGSGVLGWQNTKLRRKMAPKPKADPKVVQFPKTG